MKFRGARTAPMCTAKIRPFPNDTEVQCEKPKHTDSKHESVLRDYAYPGSETVLAWMETDRRNFRGDWRPCLFPTCILPANHRGDHAF